MTTETKLKDLNELYTNLTAPFPKEAYMADSSRGFALTSVKAQYIVERLNNTLGFNNWRIDGRFDKQEDGSVLYEGQLILFLGDYAKMSDGSAVIHSVPTVGFAKSGKNLGDTYKSAKTDALSKGTSYIGVANDVFKGLVNPDGSPKAPGSPVAAKKTTKKAASTASKTTKKTTKKAASFAGKKPVNKNSSSMDF